MKRRSNFVSNSSSSSFVCAFKNNTEEDLYIYSWILLNVDNFKEEYFGSEISTRLKDCIPSIKNYISDNKCKYIVHSNGVFTIDINFHDDRCESIEITVHDKVEDVQTIDNSVIITLDTINREELIKNAIDNNNLIVIDVKDINYSTILIPHVMSVYKIILDYKYDLNYINQVRFKGLIRDFKLRKLLNNLKSHVELYLEDEHYKIVLDAIHNTLYKDL